MSKIRQQKAASVHQLLLNLAKSSGRPFNELLGYYAMERFLFRISQSEYVDQFVLKGALLLRTTGISEIRSTRDIDLLGPGKRTISEIKRMIAECCTVGVPEDGLEFAPGEIEEDEIRKNQAYDGYRYKIKGSLGSARILIQIDIGFGDIVTPEPLWIEFPSILDGEKPKIQAYTLVSAIAEKYQAMIDLDMLNSRMKDFYDIYFLCQNLPFEGALLQKAIEQTFQRRKTAIPSVLPTVFTATFYENKPFSELPVVQKAERMENKLSEIYDGFAGIWFEPEREEMVVSLVEQESFAAQRESILSEITSQILKKFDSVNIGINVESFRIKETGYTFHELQYIRDVLTPVIHERDDIVESYINVEENAFSIAILKTANRIDYQNLLRTYSISENGVIIYEGEPVEVASNPMTHNMLFRSNHTLEDRVRPLRGGLLIRRPIPESNYVRNCTFGFNIKLNGVNKWITNSHCTYDFSHTGNTPFYQQSVPLSTHFIGIEYRDYEGGGSVRFSDAAIIDHSGGQQLAFNEILWTEYPGMVWGDHGSIDLIPYQNDYARAEILGEFEDYAPLFQGLQIHKIGQRTGWTIGTIRSNCTNISNISGLSGWTLACQIRSNAYARSGDSGSPVFWVDSPDYESPALLVGLLWGRSTAPLQTRSYHSRIHGIRADLLQSGETMTTY